MSQLTNFRLAYQVLTQDVTRAIHTQVGDEYRLSEQRNRALRFLEAAEQVRTLLQFFRSMWDQQPYVQHRQVFPLEEFMTLQQSIGNMVHELDEAALHSADPQDPGISLHVVHEVRTGRRGRPRKDIDINFLRTALELRGPTHIAPVIGTSSKTVRRWALEANLVQPGQPVFEYFTHNDGTVERLHNSGTRPTATLSDNALDEIVHSILESFPAWGRRMLAGRLESLGHHVPRERLIASYLRAHGPPGSFGDRTIHRRTYSVAGANSLWHHDGQHGMYFLIHWILEPAHTNDVL